VKLVVSLPNHPCEIGSYISTSFFADNRGYKFHFLDRNSPPYYTYLYHPEEVTMKIRVVIEFDPVTKSYAAYCPELPGCTSAGDTEEEAYENMKEAVRLYFQPTDIPAENSTIHELVI